MDQGSFVTRFFRTVFWTAANKEVTQTFVVFGTHTLLEESFTGKVLHAIITSTTGNSETTEHQLSLTTIVLTKDITLASTQPLSLPSITISSVKPAIITSAPSTVTVTATATAPEAQSITHENHDNNTMARNPSNDAGGIIPAIPLFIIFAILWVIFLALVFFRMFQFFQKRRAEKRRIRQFLDAGIQLRRVKPNSRFSGETVRDEERQRDAGRSRATLF